MICFQEESDTKISLVTYDITTGRLCKKFEANSNYVCVEISEEYHCVIAALENCKILIYDLSGETEK